MRWLVYAALLACACSRGSLQAIDHLATADASDTRPAIDTALPDTRPPCPRLTTARGNTDQNVGADRSYILHIPDSYDGSRPVPLILDFHLHQGSAQIQSTTSLYLKPADADGVIMAFPSGLVGPGGASWNVGPCCVDADDVGFTMAMLDHIKSLVCIDEKRIYAVGNFTGGGMALTLACRKAEIFAGIAPSQWDLLSGVDCNPSRFITVVSFRDPTDTWLVPYVGGKSDQVKVMPIEFMGAVNTFRAWADKDNCTGTPSAEDSNGCSWYSNCGDKVEVGLCTRAPGLAGNDANIAWPLLRKHTR